MLSRIIAGGVRRARDRPDRLRGLRLRSRRRGRDLLRRTVAAMAVTLVAFAAVLVAVPLLRAPVHAAAAGGDGRDHGEDITNISGDDDRHRVQEIGVRNPAGAWVLANETVDPNGNVASPLPDFVQNCLPRPGSGRARRNAAASSSAWRSWATSATSSA
jgi:hypothetical protein